MNTWNFQIEAKNFLSILRPSFHILTITFLSLSVPLSFLLLARLSCYSYLFSNWSSDSSFLFNLVLQINPSILHFLLSLFSIATLLHVLTGKITFLSEKPGQLQRPGLFTAWILLSVVLVCVALGIEGSIEAGMDRLAFDIEMSLVSRVVVFLGLHETMSYWSRCMVKPVVDDTVFGSVREESWVQRLSLTLAFGCLWWRLREEVESLVIVAEAKREMLVAVNLADLLSWWLYYLTVTIGMVRVVKTLMWVLTVFLFRKVTRVDNSDLSEQLGAENKV